MKQIYIKYLYITQKIQIQLQYKNYLKMRINIQLILIHVIHLIEHLLQFKVLVVEIPKHQIRSLI